MHLGAAPPYLCLLRRNFCAAGGVLLWLQRCDFRTVKKPFPLTTAAQNMHVLLRKLPPSRKHFFVRLKTAISSNACGTSTLKSLLLLGSNAPHVHLRLRKRLSRCTLDCGFKTSESPALRGFEAERAPIRGTSLYLVLKSNGLHHSENLPVKFGFSLKIVPATIAKKLPPQRCFKPLFIAFFNFSHKRPAFAFAGESGYTLGFRRRIAHSGSHGETRGVSDGGGITTLGAFRTFTNIPGPGIRTASFAAFGAWSGVLPKNAESLRNSDALMRVAVPRRRGPAGLRDLFLLLSELWPTHHVFSAFRMCETRGGITTLGVLCVLLKRRTAACQNGSFAVF